jgi:hypothetical protein
VSGNLATQTHFRRQVFPVDPRLEHEKDASQGFPIVYPVTTKTVRPLWRWRRRKEWLDALPERVGDEDFCHDEAPRRVVIER